MKNNGIRTAVFSLYFSLNYFNRICVPFSWVCDGEEDCPYGDDESNCTNIPDQTRSTISQCYSDVLNQLAGYKENSRCIIETHCSRANSSKICHPWSNCQSHDGTFVPNCHGPSMSTRFQDEGYLEEFQCDDEYSVPLSWVCDKLVDCPEAQDEIGCKTFKNTISQLLLRTDEGKVYLQTD